jgi:hypothetical protein
LPSKTIWLTDPEAGRYPFPYGIGERLKAPARKAEGIVRNAKYSGPEHGGPCWILYYIETDEGDVLKIPLADLERSYL